MKIQVLMTDGVWLEATTPENGFQFIEEVMKSDGYISFGNMILNASHIIRVTHDA